MSIFVEQNCTFKHGDREFTSGGDWICNCSDGFRRGVVYASNDSWGKAGHGTVTDWHGNKIADAYFGPVYHGNFRDVTGRGVKTQSVTFVVDGVKFAGRYCPDGSQAIRVKSTKRVRK